MTSAACVLLLSGCYRYVPVTGTLPAPNAEVRLHLTPEGTSRLEPSLGPQTVIVAGRVETEQPDGLALLVSSTIKSHGATTRWIGERVTVPAAAIARSERRVLDRRRSLLAGGGVALAAAAGYALLRAVTGGGEDGDPGGPGPTP